MKSKTYQNDLVHIYSAYKYFVSCIPQEELFVNGKAVIVGSTHFEKPSQASSMRVELGWAFFTRMEACLEALLHSLNVKLNKKQGLLEYLQAQGIELSEDQKDGLGVYREIRNVLHHGDGDLSHLNKASVNLKIDSGYEPHLLEEQIGLFYELFRDVGNLLLTNRANGSA